MQEPATPMTRQSTECWIPGCPCQTPTPGASTISEEEEYWQDLASAWTDLGGEG